MKIVNIILTGILISSISGLQGMEQERTPDWLGAAVRVGTALGCAISKDQMRELPERDRKFLLAVTKGNYKRVKEAIENGADVNMQYKGVFCSNTPLIEASAKGHFKISKLLIEHGANLNATDSLEETALDKAVYYNHLPIVRLLIERGAVIDITAIKHADRGVLLEIVTTIPLAEQQKMKKTVYILLRELKKGEPSLPADVQNLLKQPIIESQIDHFTTKQMLRARALIDTALNNAEDIAKIRSLQSLKSQEGLFNLRKSIRNNIMRILFGEPAGSFATSVPTMETEKVERTRLIKELSKEERVTDRSQAESSYYRILGVPMDATADQINDAFDREIQPYIGETYQTGISKKHAELMQAYEVLNNPAKRAAYNKTLIKREFK